MGETRVTQASSGVHPDARNPDWYLAERRRRREEEASDDRDGEDSETEKEIRKTVPHLGKNVNLTA